ncbi:MAG TPA: hypothetical protein PKH79_04875, partial [Prolixibacteraceae bacterium]|nr:hypothetical protein [Prolixibacteraceae bacterium]
MKQTLQTLKKVFAAAILAVLLSFQVKAETPAITLVAENPDTTLVLQLAAGISKTTIQIDWGKGIKTSYSIDTSLTVIRNPSVQSGQTTISVYGPSITALNCANDRLSGLDVKNCTSLRRLYCSKNQIQALDITANVNLTTLDCRYNLFTFSTLPLPKAALRNYVYAPQRPASVKKTLNAGDQIDLSSYSSVADGTGTLHNTSFTWKNGIGETLVHGTDYAVSLPGVFTFSAKPVHVIYCELTNDLFPAFNGADVYRTSSVTPEGFTLPLAFTATSAGVSEVSIGLSAVTSGMPVKIVWGNGNTVNTELDFLETEFETIKSPNSSINISVYGEGVKS